METKQTTFNSCFLNFHLISYLYEMKLLILHLAIFSCLHSLDFRVTNLYKYDTNSTNIKSFIL